jgi:hypothetical protein
VRWRHPDGATLDVAIGGSRLKLDEGERNLNLRVMPNQLDNATWL